MTKKEEISLAIIASDLHKSKLYSTILTSEHAIVPSLMTFDSVAHNVIKSYDIFIIDIGTRTELQAIEGWEFDSEKKIIFITPYSLKNSKLAKYKYCFILQKPLDSKHLLRMIGSFLVEIRKFNYITSKKNILASMIEDSLFRMAVYNLRGILEYANLKYLIANKIDNDMVSELHFDAMTRCTTEFNDIISALQKNDYFTLESKQQESWYQSHFYFIQNRSFVVHICIDITTQKNHLIELQREALFFQKTNEGLAIVSEKGIILSINDAFSRITGYTIEEAVGRSISLLNSGLHTKDFYEHMWDMLMFHGRWQGEIWNRRKNFEVYPEWLSITASIDPVTNKKSYLALFTDISSIKEADKKIKFYANHDPLTGLLNKNQFENILSHTIDSCERNNRKFALLFLDLDHFKEVNDTFGHTVGDILLKTIAGIFKKILRKEDVIARIGGDEFTIIIDNIKDEIDILIVAKNLNDAVREPIIIDGNSCEVSLSIGIALYPIHGSDKTALTKNADSAMYEVKKNGRDGTMIYHSKLSEDLLRRILLQSELKLAVAHNEIEIYFQPVYDTRSCSMIGCEVLARWFHKTHGFIPPDEFIAIAETSSLISLLDTQMMRNLFSVMGSFLV